MSTVSDHVTANTCDLCLCMVCACMLQGHAGTVPMQGREDPLAAAAAAVLAVEAACGGGGAPMPEEATNVSTISEGHFKHRMLSFYDIRHSLTSVISEQTTSLGYLFHLMLVGSCSSFICIDKQNSKQPINSAEHVHDLQCVPTYFIHVCYRTGA